MMHFKYRILYIKLSVVSLLFSISVQAKCKTTFITTCESISDVIHYGKQPWKSLIISKDLCNNEEFLESPLATLEYGTFQECYNLEELYIIQQLNNIHAGAFNGLDHLTYLKLYKNTITVVLQGAFSNFSQLVKLDLSDNYIENIQHGIFHTSYINWIILSNNKLNNIQVDQVDIPSLKKLTVTHNNIVNVVPKCFHKNLEYLDLDHNKIQHIAPGVLEPLQKLKVLILSNNKIDGIDISLQLDSLQKLDLSHNAIVGVSGYSFAKFPELKYLDLGYNQIKHLSHNIFANKTKIEVLKLHNNLLITLDGEMENKLPLLKEISIGANPWICACLALINEFIAHKRVRQSLCEEDYFSNGQFPVCSVIDNNSACTGSEILGDSVYNSFRKAIASYKCYT